MTDPQVKKNSKLNETSQGAQGAKEKKTDDPEVKDALKESRNVVGDKFTQPGGLEVEVMPESTELQDRLRNTKDALKETTVVEATGENLFDDEAGGLMDLLSEANLSPKHFKFCCGGVFVVLLLAAMVFGAYKGIEYWQDRPDQPDGPEVVEEATEDADEIADGDVEEYVQEVTSEYDYADPSVIAGVMVGDEVAEEDEALEAGEGLGEELVSEDELAAMISDFAAMYEAMEVDVVEMLDASRDRQDTLDSYQNELNYLIYVGGQNLDKLVEDSELLAAKFAETEEYKNALEVRFFEKMRELDAYGSTAALDAFIVEAEEIVRLRAEYSARQKLVAYYAAILEQMQLRVTDIELNEEALVKGVQVVDIAGSDIDLIIDESEL